MKIAMEDNEYTFLCGYQRNRGYGTILRGQSTVKHYTSVVKYKVEANDTLQGIALRFNTSVCFYHSSFILFN